jgi:hypothetical protein
LNAGRQGLSEGGDSQQDGGCNESEKSFQAHGSPFQVSAANYMRENFMALRRGCESLMELSDGALGRRSARRWKERCRQRRMYVRRRADELVRGWECGGGGLAASPTSQNRDVGQAA